MVKIISDSTCDLSQEIVDRYNLDIVPLAKLLAHSGLPFNGLFRLIMAGKSDVKAGCFYILIHGSSSILLSQSPGNYLPFGCGCFFVHANLNDMKTSLGAG